MKTVKFLFVLSIMLVFAVSANSQGMGKQIVRPMKGSFYAVDVPPYGNPQLLALSGNATHLGNFSGEELFFKPPAYSPYVSGKLVAANGDEICFRGNPILGIAGLNPYPHGTLSGKIIIDGGSGRFTDCSGEVDITGVFDMNANCASWTADGWIKY